MPARSFQTPAARHMAGRKPPNLLFRQSSPRRLSPVCQDDSFSLQQKRRLRRSANLLYFLLYPFCFFHFRTKARKVKSFLLLL
jgi:hypothetical protein